MIQEILDLRHVTKQVEGIENFRPAAVMVNNKKIHYAAAGSGKELVFVHGWSNNWYGWIPLADMLRKRYRLYLLDLPGYGASDDVSINNLDVQAFHIKAFIRRLKIRPHALIGASMGTVITANTISRYPGLSDNLIMIGTPWKELIFSPKAKVMLEHTLDASLRSPLALKVVEKVVRSRFTGYAIERFISAYRFDRRLIDMYSVPGRGMVRGRAYAQLGISARDFDFTRFFSNCTKNVLLLYGEADGYIKIDRAGAMVEKHNPDIKLCLIPNAGHNPAYEEPRLTAESIMRFL